MDAEFVKYFATLGVGGALAAFMFMFYRKDVQSYTEIWKLAAEQLIVVIKENTSSNVKLIGLIESQERNALRKSDIEMMIDRRTNPNQPTQPTQPNQMSTR